MLTMSGLSTIVFLVTLDTSFHFIEYTNKTADLSNLKGKPSTTPNVDHYSAIFHNAAVAADNKECSKIGKNILLSGGSAVDSAIASMLCVGFLSSHR